MYWSRGWERKFGPSREGDQRALSGWSYEKHNLAKGLRVVPLHGQPPVEITTSLTCYHRRPGHATASYRVMTATQETASSNSLVHPYAPR